MNTKMNEAATNKGNPYFLTVPWNKVGLVNMGPVTFLSSRSGGPGKFS